MAGRFLQDLPECDDKLKDAIANHMAFCHESVTEASKRYAEP